MMRIARDADKSPCRALYDKFKLLDSIRLGSITNPGATLFTVNGVSLISAYYGYVQLIKNIKLVFARDSMAVPLLAEKIYRAFPAAFRGISLMLDIMAVPEVVGRLRKDVERDTSFISAGICTSVFSIDRHQHSIINLGLENIYSLSHAVSRQEWHDSAVSEVSQSCINHEVLLSWEFVELSRIPRWFVRNDEDKHSILQHCPLGARTGLLSHHITIAWRQSG